jgi:hypothetical protein
MSMGARRRRGLACQAHGFSARLPEHDWGGFLSGRIAMRTNTWVTVLLTAVVFAVGGYFIGMRAAPPSRPPPVPVSGPQPTGQNCGGALNCNVEIDVDKCNPAHPDPAVCEVYALQEVTLINAGNKTINFDIKTNGFTFNSQDGIAFTSFMGGNGIFNCSPSNPSSSYVCKVTNPNGEHGPFKYTIHVQGLNVVDPWVVNY